MPKNFIDNHWARKIRVSLTPKIITPPFVSIDKDMEGDCACGGQGDYDVKELGENKISDSQPILKAPFIVLVEEIL